MPLPSCAVAVIFTDFPPDFFFNVTTPELLTVAIFLLLEDQVTALFAAFAGDTDAFSFTFFPAAILPEIPERVMDEILIIFFSSIDEVSFFV